MRKILATLLAVCTVLSMLVVVPITATAETVGYVAPADDAIITTAEAVAANYTDLAEHGANDLVSGNKYYIQNETGLTNLSSLVNSRKTTAGSEIYVTEDIVMTATSFTPIAYNNTGTAFAGYFNGQGHKISNLKQNGANMSNTVCYYGLFGLVSGTVENVVLDSCYFWVNVASATDGLRGAGSIAGYVTGTVENCYSKSYISVRTTMAYKSNGSTTNSAYGCGGIAGVVTSSGKISNCTFESITFESTVANNLIGGIVGQSASQVIGCKSYANITVSGGSYIGGVAGYGTAGALNCENHGTISKTNTGSSIGGIFGRLQGGTVNGCLNTGAVYANAQAGGLIGSGDDGSKVTIQNSVNRGAVTIGEWSVGGFVGYFTNELEITDCANYGAVSGTRAGGIVGYAGKTTTITNTKNYGLVTGNGNGGVSAIVALAGSTVTLTNVQNYAKISGSGEVDYGDTITDYRNTPTHFYGYQTRTNEEDSSKVDLRFVGSIDSENYYRAGFKITVTNKDTKELFTTIEEDVAHAYVELLQEGGNITVPAYRGEGALLFALVVEGIPTADLDNYTFTVETYSIKDQNGSKTAGDISTPNFSIVLQ